MSLNKKVPKEVSLGEALRTNAPSPKYPSRRLAGRAVVICWILICASNYNFPMHYSLFRMILPLMVLGSSVRNSTIRGYL